MKHIMKTLVLGFSLPGLLLADFSAEAPLGVSLTRDAHALVGAPLTPLSYAGVARRTTRRVVAVEATAVTAAAATATAATATATAATATAASAQQQAAAQQNAQAAPPPAGAPAIGSIVSALPGGCVSAPKGGVEYYQCGGVYYRAAFQGNNLVYVVQQP